MKHKKTFGVGDFGLFYETETDDVKITRFSPRSYRNGENIGFMCGIAVGFVAGIMFICLFFGIL